MPEVANRPMEQQMKLHKLKAGEATGTYLVDSPVSEADIADTMGVVPINATDAKCRRNA